MNLTQWRNDAKAQRAQRCDYCAVIPDFYPVIPAKAGIQRVADNVIVARSPSLRQPRARYVNAP